MNGLEKLKALGFYPKNILDIGAYEGAWSLSAMKLFPNSRITMVEAIDYDWFKPMKGLDPEKASLRYKNALLFEDEREVDWYELRNTGDSIYKENTSHFEDCEPIKRQTVTLDS